MPELAHVRYCSTNSKIEAQYRARTRRSAELYQEASRVIPAGLTHDSRTLLPYPIYAPAQRARANGTSTATSTSIISAATARCCSAMRTPP